MPARVCLKYRVPKLNDLQTMMANSGRHSAAKSNRLLIKSKARFIDRGFAGVDVFSDFI